MTTSVGSIGSVQVGAVQILGAAGASVRVMARLYDPDSVLLAATNVESVTFQVLDSSAPDSPLVEVSGILPSSVLASISTAAKWTKDSTGFVFDHLVPATIAMLLVGGRSYVLRYIFDTPRVTPTASGTDFGNLRFDVTLGAS